LSYRLGIDIGGTKICIGLVSVAQEVTLLGYRKLEVSHISDIVAEIKNAVEALCEELRCSSRDIAFCGVGIPGTVSEDGRRILKAPNISVLSAAFAERLAQALGMPVTLLQDSRAAAWGEYCCGAGRGAQTLICITLGTGIGTGIVIDGQLFHGALGTAGELGHVPAVPNGRSCGCGKRGCVEKYCAGGGLDITARELLGAGKTAKDLFCAAKEGHQQAQHAIHEAICLLGNTVVAAINLLSPNAVLFSGGMSNEAALIEPLISYIKEHCYTIGTLPILKKASLGEFAPLIGAAMASK